MKSKINENDNFIFSEKNISKNILPAYNLSNANVTMIKFKNTEKQRAVYKITYNNINYCLKKVYFPEDDLLYVYSALEWLHRNNINVPNLIPSIDNNRFVNFKDMLFILTPWVDGIKCDFDNYTHTLLSIAELAKLHKVSKNFIPIEGSSHRKKLDNIFLSNNKHLEQLLIASNLAYKYNDNFSKLFLSQFDAHLELAKLASEISAGIDNISLSKSLCHGDYVNKNILIADNKKVWIIDFDKCRYDYCAHDISYFMRRLLKRSSTNWNLELTFNLLKKYNYINPLNKSDLRYIVSYLCFPQKYWKLSRDYYKNIYKCNKSTFISLINKTNLTVADHLKFSYTIINEFDKTNWCL